MEKTGLKLMSAQYIQIINDHISFGAHYFLFDMHLEKKER